MTKSNFHKILTGLFRIGLIYMILEVMIHLSGIRLLNLELYWPTEAVYFAQLFMLLWGSSTVLWVILIHQLLTNYSKNRHLLHYISLFAFIHALVVLYISRIPYEQVLPTQASMFWIPFYSLWLKIESILLFAFFLFIQYGKRKNYL